MFNAKNNVTIKVEDSGTTFISEDTLSWWVHPKGMDALKEFYLHKFRLWESSNGLLVIRDEWNDYWGEGRCVLVVNPSDGANVHLHEFELDLGAPADDAANEYFKEHPEDV